MVVNGLILVAEPERTSAACVLRNLKILGYRARLAVTAQRAIEFLRQEVFAAAVVAVELGCGSESLLEGLASLPSMRLLVATGPPDDWGWELTARGAGAIAYLPRPVTHDSLARVLRPGAVPDSRGEFHGQEEGRPGAVKTAAWQCGVIETLARKTTGEEA